MAVTGSGDFIRWSERIFAPFHGAHLDFDSIEKMSEEVEIKWTTERCRRSFVVIFMIFSIMFGNLKSIVRNRMFSATRCAVHGKGK